MSDDDAGQGLGAGSWIDAIVIVASSRGLVQVMELSHVSMGLVAGTQDDWGWIAMLFTECCRRLMLVGTGWSGGCCRLLSDVTVRSAVGHVGIGGLVLFVLL